MNAPENALHNKWNMVNIAVLYLLITKRSKHTNPTLNVYVAVHLNSYVPSWCYRSI